MRRVVSVVLVCGAVACVVGGALRGVNAPGGSERGERLVYGFTGGGTRPQLATAVEMIQGRLAPGQGRVHRDGDTVVVELLGVGDYEVGRLREVIARRVTVELEPDDDRADFQTALVQHAGADPIAVVNGITIDSDSWTSDDDVFHRGAFLSAVDRDEEIGAGEARAIGCLDRHSSTVAAQRCKVTGRHAIERYLAELAGRDADYAVPADHVIGYEDLGTAVRFAGGSHSWRTYYLLDGGLDGTEIRSAVVTNRAIEVELGPGGAMMLDTILRDRVGHKLAVVVDGRVRAAVVLTRGRHGSLSIPPGALPRSIPSPDRGARIAELALAINAGALPPLVERSAKPFTRELPGFLGRSWMLFAGGLAFGLGAMLLLSPLRRRGKLAT